jgi:phosphohistidine swiveling domain-containing protein
MRVLISGVTSDLGRSLARAALGAGHEVTGVGAQSHRDLPPAVALTVGDALAAEGLVAGCDVLVHLAPVEREVPESGGIPGLRRMAMAAARHGVRFVVPIAHGPDASDADRVVRDSGTQHIVIRTAPLGGRHLDWQACRTIATLLSAPKDTQWRLLHSDDLVRFLLHAIASDRLGAVSLAAEDVIPAGRARDVLRAVAPSVRGIPQWPAMSTSERKNSAGDWGFEYGWTSLEVVADLARGARGRTLTKDGAVDILARLPMPAEELPRRRPPADGTALASVALPSMAVELDDRIDPRYPVFSAHPTAELFPGSLTPLSIDVHTAGLRAAGRVAARLAGLSGPLADEWESRAHVVFGHHLYAGVSSVAAAPLPGFTEYTVAGKMVGPRAGVELFPLERPESRGLVGRLAAWARFVSLARRYRAAVKSFAATADAERATGLAARADAELVARACLLHDRLAEGWTLTQTAAHVAHVVGGPLRKRAKGDAMALGRGADAANEPTFVAVAGLTDLLHADEELRALAEWGDLDAVRMKYPDFSTALDEAVARIGHRGPGETELSSSPFADRPGLVFAAAVSAARRPLPTPPEPEPVAAEPVEDPMDEPLTESAESGESTEDTSESTEDTAPTESTVETPVRAKRTLVEKLAVAGQRQRELAVDATMRYTDELRRLVREWGRRQVHAGRLVDPSDVFYLTLAELFTPPADALARVERRRADRERLRAVRMPAVVTGSWRPEARIDPMREGQQLTGVGASAGVVEGPVRVVTEAAADVEPGEVAVLRVADAGHAALFGPAAAIVTDLGGPLSRAAIIARELGVPCVTGARDASARLVNGTLVRVDGSTGDVVVLSPVSVRS